MDHEAELNGYLQGMLHTHLRNPPTFLVDGKTEGELRVKVRAVATLRSAVLGRQGQIVDLPDLDHKNDGGAREYDKVFTFRIPPGRPAHGENVGWMTVSWRVGGGICRRNDLKVSRQFACRNPESLDTTDSFAV